MNDNATTDDPRIIGVWKLKAQVYEDTVTGDRIPIFGDHPKGRQIATRDGRWLALATAEDRLVPKTDAERAKALMTMIAYTGRYRLRDGVVRTKVEAAWNESWVGGEQVRHVRFENDDLLHIRSPEMPHPNLLDRKVYVVVTWEREEDLVR
ncbi:MAG: lipocalin-like domain-containing protein [Pseudorhodoplanes sp.]